MKKLKYLWQFLFVVVIFGINACGSKSTSKESCSHEAVDLGLSVKWATCNVGADSPEEYGDYYAWGETEVKSEYSWETYKWSNDSADSFTKYCQADNKIILDSEDDVAHVKWGGNWRMPTMDEVNELCDKCTWEWTTVNGVAGQLVTGPNGNSIFLPAAGLRCSSSETIIVSSAPVAEDDKKEFGSETLGYYRFSSKFFTGFEFSEYLGGGVLLHIKRHNGCSVRPVCD